MSLIEGIGSAVGSVASGVSGGVGGAAASICSGLEGGLGGAASVSGLTGGISAASFCEGPMPVSPVGGFEPISASLEGLEPMGKLDLGAMDLKGGSNQSGFSLAGEILFQVEPQLNEVSVLAEVDNILAQAKIDVIPANAGIQSFDQTEDNSLHPFNGSGSELDPRLRGDDRNENNHIIIEPLVYPELPSWEVVVPQKGCTTEPKTKTVVEEAEEMAQKAWDNHVITQVENIVNSMEEEAPVTVSAVEEVAEEVEEEEQDEEEIKSKEVLEEEEVVEREFYLEDEQTSMQRRHEIKEAIAKARVEADRLGLKKIAGWLVAKFLPNEHEGNRSQVVKKKGPDGSYQETIEAISEAGELESEEQAIVRFNSVVEDKKPVKRGKEGKRVGLQEVARVFKYYLVKPSQPQSEVVKRLVVVHAVAEKPKSEPSIAAFPKLEEVFKQAA